MKSAIRWTLWIRFDDDGPISVVYETSFVLIPSAFALAVVRSGALGPSVISAAPPSAAAAATADATCGADEVESGLRRNDTHALPLHDEPGVLRADDPLAEARPEDPREVGAGERDVDVMRVRRDPDGAGNLLGRQLPAGDAEVVDLDGLGDERLCPSRRGGRLGVRDLRLDDRERRLDRGLVVLEQAQQPVLDRAACRRAPGLRRRAFRAGAPSPRRPRGCPRPGLSERCSRWSRGRARARCRCASARRARRSSRPRAHAWPWRLRRPRPASRAGRGRSAGPTEIVTGCASHSSTSETICARDLPPTSTPSTRTPGFATPSYCTSRTIAAIASTATSPAATSSGVFESRWERQVSHRCRAGRARIARRGATRRA